MGQTGSNIRNGYKEHIPDIRQNSDKSKYAEHIFEQEVEYGQQNVQCMYVKRPTNRTAKYNKTISHL